MGLRDFLLEQRQVLPKFYLLWGQIFHRRENSYDLPVMGSLWCSVTCNTCGCFPRINIIALVAVFRTVNG